MKSFPTSGLLRAFAVSTLALAPLAAGTGSPALEAQEARARWERMCQIRAEKFDLVLPKAMADNDLDMWIVVMREGLLDPLWEALGRGYVGDWAFYVFTRQGDRVERAALGVWCANELRLFVSQIAHRPRPRGGR